MYALAHMHGHVMFINDFMFVKNTFSFSLQRIKG